MTKLSHLAVIVQLTGVLMSSLLSGGTYAQESTQETDKSQEADKSQAANKPQEPILVLPSLSDHLDLSTQDTKKPKVKIKRKAQEQYQTLANQQDKAVEQSNLTPTVPPEQNQELTQAPMSAEPESKVTKPQKVQANVTPKKKTLAKKGKSLVGIEPVIPTDIYEVSTHYVADLGTFRHVLFNSQHDPCFVLEFYQSSSANGLTKISRVCEVTVDGKRFSVLSDGETASWFDGFQWQDERLTFQLENEDRVSQCSLPLPTMVKKEMTALPRCQSKES